MTYAALFRHTIIRRKEEGDKSLRSLRAAEKTFYRISGRTAAHECDDAVLTDENIQRLRAYGEKDGLLSGTVAASWVSRMKHVLTTYEVVKLHKGDDSFPQLLKAGLQKTGLSQSRTAKLSGCPLSSLNFWVCGKNLGAESTKYIPKLDEVLQLEGRLIAYVATMNLQCSTRIRYTEEEKAKFERGDGTLHQLFNYFCRTRNIPRRRAFARFRSALRDPLYNTGRIKGRSTKLHVTQDDRSAFKALDDEAMAEGKIVKAFDRHLEAQPPKHENIKFNYELWPERLKGEWQDFVAYKKTNPKGLEKTAHSGWSVTKLPHGTLVCSSEKRTRHVCEYLFGWALRNGVVKTPEELRLAHMIVPEIVIGTALDTAQRNGRTKLTKGDRRDLRSIHSLYYGGDDKSNPGLGYFANDSVGAIFARDPFFEQRLPTSYEAFAPGGYHISHKPIRIPKSDFRSRWQAYLAQISKVMERHMATATSPTGNFAHTVSDILQNKDFEIAAWLNGGFLKLVETTPGKLSAPKFWATHVRNTVIFLFLITRAFRRGTLFRLELQHVPFNPDTKQYQFIIPEGLFKQRGKGGSKGGVYADIESVFPELDTSRPTLIPTDANLLLKTYIEEARVILKNNTTSFFGFKNDVALSTTITNTTRKALGRHVNAHAFRYLIATWAKRKGIPVEDTAAILCHMPQATRQIYDLTTAQDVGVRTTAAIKKLYS